VRKLTEISPLLTNTLSRTRLRANGDDADCLPDEYCVVNEKTGKKIRLTTEEKERIYLDALQSYYYSGRELLSGDDFELLKEDLAWSGSDVITMNRKEVSFLSLVVG